MSDDNKQLALAEKDLGNQAYKKREFDVALGHYDKAYELDNTNITFLTNKAGKLKQIFLIWLWFLTGNLLFFSCSFRTRKVRRMYQGL